MRQIIGIGETVLDIIFKNDLPQTAVPGGSTFNAVISLGRAGVPCSIVTEAGDDHVGDMTCRYLRENNVSDRFVNRNKGVQSHISLAFLDENNDARYLFYKNHAGASVSAAMAPDFTDEDIVLFGSFFAVNPVIRREVSAMLGKAYSAGSVLYYDINFRASHIKDIPATAENIRENMCMATVVRGSLEDFGYLYGTQDATEIYERHVRPCCPLFICTDGGNPVEVFTPLWRRTFPAGKIETVSTVGAGDNFNAGFIYALTCGDIDRTTLLSLPVERWEPLICMAQAFSSDVCQQYGNSVSAEFVASLER
ncbi:MAG: PfkB family carbohydrate kinase [Bacteroidales bacterium]|nr:PfkB family carbohydrate kinase [Bacteroidales bacterium]MCM1146593.1 PfkB family carbohydrate kinase [Bacteroidales bacterium]MCM1205985.1 PfkB family carbohydrate kinase [Bacillota bacterium]MCM1510134.1 PfkB family carbohydrate kinase [Clostridium sp.]